MSDEQREEPFYSPFKRPAPPRKARAGLEVWRLRNGDRVMTCELRDDDQTGAGFDVQLLEDGELCASRRCVNVDGAEFIAESYKQDLLRTGWSE